MKNSNRRQPRIVISGGGTGGHIFPAIAIAHALREKIDPEILFIGARDKMEMTKVPEAGYPIKGLWISGLQRRITLKNILFPAKVIVSLWQARQILKQFDPQVVVGVGGYASGPTLKAAAGMHIPCLIQEQNSYPGITNKHLAKSVDKICVAYEGMEDYFPESKIIFTGNPVRKDIIQITGKRNEAAEFFNLNPDKKTVLVVGGSQGALAINQAIQRHLDIFVREGIQLIWQTGKPFYPEARSAIERLPSHLIALNTFINRMDMAYALADVVVSRAGAIAISEICAVGKPPVFIPLPTAAEDHQTKNALALVDSGAAWMIRNHEANDQLMPALLNLIHDEQKQSLLRENLLKLAKPNAADVIADEIIKLIDENKWN